MHTLQLLNIRYEKITEFIDEIDKRRTTNFKVTKIPVGTLREFKELCKEEYGDVYSVGIIQLMKIKKQYEKLLEILSKPKPKPQINTFGDKQI